MLVFMVAFDVGQGFGGVPRNHRGCRRGSSSRYGSCPLSCSGFSRRSTSCIASAGWASFSPAATGSAGRSAQAASPQLPRAFTRLCSVCPCFSPPTCSSRPARPGGSGRWPLVTLLIVAATLLLINPISSARYSFGTVAFGLILVTLLPLRLTVYRFLLLGTSSVIIFAFQVFNRFRFDDSTASGAITLDPYAQLRHGDYDAFQQTAHAVEFVQATGFHPGQLLGPLVFWVPRVWWPEKPYDTGIVLAAFKGFNFKNLSAPIPAELYVAGGVALVALGGFLMGYAWLRMDQHLTRFGATGFIGLVVPILAVYQFILLRGSLLQAMAAAHGYLGAVVVRDLASLRQPKTIIKGHASRLRKGSAFYRHLICDIFLPFGLR